MRNKKLISMLMLSAGFVACTQDEIVENNFAGIENQKDLIEDVTFNIALNEASATRAAYAGGATEVKDGKVIKYEVYQNFYLEPEYDADGGIVLSNHEALAGDMIGFCLTNAASAITNYPFYIAGYGSAVPAATKENPNPVQYVYPLADQSNNFYNLGLPEPEEGEAASWQVAVKTNAAAGATNGIDQSIAAVKTIVKGEDGKWGDLAANALDVRKGIVRTNSGIMTGQYVAYFPYNSKFVDPAGIPAVGKKPLKSLYDGLELANDRQDALDAVNFYDYLFAVAPKTVEVKGGTKAGDVSIIPMTSALTFEFTNTGVTTDKIKRITVKAADENVKPFILNGSVDMSTLNSVNVAEGGAVALIGAGFEAVCVTGTENADKTITPATPLYVTIPYMGTPSVKDYIIEIYNTDGEIAAIEWTPKFELGLGDAAIVTIDLNGKTFEPGVRKIFTWEDFVEEAPAGGTLELMQDVVVPVEANAFELSGKDKLDLVILGDYKLGLNTGTIRKNITMEKGSLVLDMNVSVSGNIKAKEVTISSASVTGNVEAEKISVGVDGTFTQYFKAGTLDASNGKSFSLQHADIDVLNNTWGTVTTKSYTWKDANGTHTNSVKVGTLNNFSTLNVIDLTVTTLNNHETVTVSGTLNATTINNKYMGPVNNPTGATFTVNGSTNAATFNNEVHTAKLNWNSTSNMNLKVINKGVFNIGAKCSFVGSLDNQKQFVTTAQITTTSGSIVSTGTVNFNANVVSVDCDININAGKAEVAEGVTLSGNSQKLKTASGAELIKYANVGEFESAIVGVTKFEKLYTAVALNETVSEVLIETKKKLYLDAKADLILAEGSSLADVVVRGDSKISSKNATAASILINSDITLTVGTGSYFNVTGTVTNNGTYSGVGAVVDCSLFTGGGSWVDNVTPNC